MPSFAELRAKAEAAASTAKDKYSSGSIKYAPARPDPARKPSSLASTTSPASSTAAPVRPPPSRTISTASTSSNSLRAVPAPPPQPSSLEPRSHPSASPPSAAAPKPFSRYDDDDKQSMFSALDLFFDSRRHTATSNAATAASTPQTRSLPPAPIVIPTVPSPPSAPLSTRPQNPQSLPSALTPSYPPIQSYSSSALTLAHYILSESFPTPWFASPTSPLPPPLQSRSDHQSSFSWQQRNSSKHFIGMTVFGDASVVWYRISWNVSLESNPRILLERIQREARYRPVPSPWDGQRLYEAHELYGPRLAEFARRAVARGAPIGRGECWDLAHEGLVEISRELGHSELEPFVSIGRTHGHLLFWANAQEEEKGRWYGGDLYVREGDVVEWRSVKIREVGMGQGSYSLLGDPDHTAIIVGTGSPTSLPDLTSPTSSSVAYSPMSLHSLSVVEQSLGQAPSLRTYDLSAFSAGEVWIYRPCGIEALLGINKVEAVWPTEKGIQSWQVGELE